MFIVVAFLTSLLLVYVALEHVKPRLLKVACILLGSYQILMIVAGLARHLLHS